MGVKMVRLQVRCPDILKGDGSRLGVVGAGDNLRNWNEQRPLLMEPKKWPLWKVQRASPYLVTLVFSALYCAYAMSR